MPLVVEGHILNLSRSYLPPQCFGENQVLRPLNSSHYFLKLKTDVPDIYTLIFVSKFYQTGI
jgi:hypothetical protein